MAVAVSGIMRMAKRSVGQGDNMLDISHFHPDPKLANPLVGFEFDGKTAVTVKDEVQKRVAAYNSRSGVEILKKRNEDLAETLHDPVTAIKKINAAYDNLSNKVSYLWALKYQEMIESGFSPEKATEVADRYTDKLWKQELKILRYKFPYAFSDKNAGGAIEELLSKQRFVLDKAGKTKQSHQARAAIAAIGM